MMSQIRYNEDVIEQFPSLVNVLQKRAQFDAKEQAKLAELEKKVDREEKITANRLQLHVSVAQKESYSKQQNEMLISEDLKKQE